MSCAAHYNVVAGAGQRGNYMPAYKPAQPSFLTKPSVHRLAESIAHQVGWAPGGDIHKPIQNLGGRVETEDTLLTDPDQTGSLFVDGAEQRDRASCRERVCGVG